MPNQQPGSSTAPNARTVSFGRGLPLGHTEAVTSNASGFNRIARLHRDLSTIRDSRIVLDFSGVSWVDGHLTASLQTIVLLSQRNGNLFSVSNVAPKLFDTFCKNRFVVKKKVDQFNTVMPIKTFETKDAQDFSMYAQSYLERPEMPHMTDSLREKYFEGVAELFGNAAMHSRTSIPVVVAGQFYPNANRLVISIVDGGTGMHAAVQRKVQKDITAQDAIDWAMVPGNTTRSGDVPGGLGSKILREFTIKNRGKMTVVSNDGFWMLQQDTVTKRHLNQPFPGTIVVLEINTADKQSYDLAIAPDPYKIW